MIKNKTYVCGCAAVLAMLVVQLAGCGNNTAAERPKDDKSPSAPKAEENAEKSAKPKKHTNRLAKETSLYLRMHAHNPVNWYPWGEEALAKAKKENKIIFLSIGYSSCHWCHVMERESFMDKEIAEFMNENFVCIKVDREERPDVDSIYMTSLHVFYQLTGAGRGGGWPLSMFLTPDAQPFFGGTYFPARDGDRGQATGFLSIIKRVQEVWKEKPDTIKGDAKTITRVTKQQLEGEVPLKRVELNQDLLTTAQQQLDDQYDAKYGGFGFNPRNPQRPKFPEPSNLFFLIERIRNEDDKRAKEMLVFTLERMAMGGIRDHLGGGFHRYSVDRFWQIPHFEKMLYDNGQLASVYAEAYSLTKREDFRRVVEEMLEFVLREMTGKDGEFYSSLDAESEHEEGKFYRWEKQEVVDALTKEEFKLFADVYGLNAKPNFEEEYYAPQFEKPLHEIAAAREVSEDELESQLAPIRKKLFDVRAKRERPLTDKKVLTSWNGLMIRGFADAGRLLKNPRYVEAAKKSADFLLKNLRTKEGRLLRTYGEGQAKLNAYLNDYAFLINGLISLHQATGEQKWLDIAEQLMKKQIELFWDDARGGFYFTSSDHEALLARSKTFFDGAQPSGISVSAENLVLLSQALNNPDYLERAEKTIQSAGQLLDRSPAAATRMMVAVSLFVKVNDAESKEAKD